MQYTKCTNFGIKICAIFLQNLLDKMCGMWYNGKFGARPAKAPGRAPSKKQPLRVALSYARE